MELLLSSAALLNGTLDKLRAGANRRNLDGLEEGSRGRGPTATSTLRARSNSRRRRPPLPGGRRFPSNGCC